MGHALAQHTLGLLDDNDLETLRDYVLVPTEKLRPVICPKAKEILPPRAVFRALWAQMTPLEQRARLKDIFAGLYFDGHGRLGEARPHARALSFLIRVDETSRPWRF